MSDGVDRMAQGKPHTPKPYWLRRRLPSGPEYERVRSLIRRNGLHTVCQEARCPNQFECFSASTATFLIMGPNCTRSCRFCNIEDGPVNPPDPREPQRVADAARRMHLRYMVITSVTRDDLADGGASFFAETIAAVRKAIPDVSVEVLIPDFQGDSQALSKVVAAGPNVLNHNIETVSRLYSMVRPQAVYQRSLDLIRRAGQLDASLPVKSGLMLGLGETDEEVHGCLVDLRAAGCRMLTIGQYLQPSEKHLPVVRFVPPEEFESWRRKALRLGFTEVASAPFVRSSYQAGKQTR